MRRTAGAALTWLLVVTAAPACEPPGDDLPASARVRYDTIRGVVHVVSGPRGAWTRGGSWSVAADRGVRIGRTDGPEAYTFGEIGGIAVTEDGRIYVGDTQAHEVRVFDAAGEHLFSFGREGEGPGEVRNISGLALAPDGVAVLDGRLGRLTVFSRDGEYRRSFRLGRPFMILAYGAAMRFDRQGRFYDRSPLDASVTHDSIGVFVYSPEGQPLDTVRLAAPARDHLLVERDGRPYMSFPRPFAPAPSLAIGPGGTIYFAEGDEYRVTALSPAGDTLRVLRRELQPRPVSAEERDSAIATVGERFQDAGATPPRDLELPERHAAIAELRADTEGNLWVLQPPGLGWRNLEWGVHDPEGRYLGAIATPILNVMHIGDEVIAGVARDELGVPRVVVYPIDKT